MKKLALLTLSLITSINAIGQDKIFTGDDQVLNVNIINKSRAEVKYKFSDYEKSPVLVLKTKDIVEIQYASGNSEPGGYSNPRNLKPLGLHVGAGLFLTVESGIAYISSDYFIIPQISLEGNLGVSDLDRIYYSIGGKFHLNKLTSQNKLTPFVGVLVGSEFGSNMIQVPIGINYITKSGFNLALSLSELFYFDSWQETLIELRIGYRLSRYNKH